MILVSYMICDELSFEEQTHQYEKMCFGYCVQVHQLSILHIKFKDFFACIFDEFASQSSVHHISYMIQES